MSSNQARDLSSHFCTYECKHENVKYCPKCKKVYCTACKQEWVDTPVYIYSTGATTLWHQYTYTQNTCVPGCH